MRKSSLLIIALAALCGCGGGGEYVPPTRMPRKREAQAPREIPEMSGYTYTGMKHRDPFVRSSAVSGARSQATAASLNFEMMRVTGYISGRDGSFVTFSGPDGSYLAMNGRIYDDEDQEVPGVAIVVQNEKLMFITDNNTVHELVIP